MYGFLVLVILRPYMLASRNTHVQAYFAGHTPQNSTASRKLLQKFIPNHKLYIYIYVASRWFIGTSIPLYIMSADLIK